MVASKWKISLDSISKKPLKKTLARSLQKTLSFGLQFGGMKPRSNRKPAFWVTWKWSLCQTYLVTLVLLALRIVQRCFKYLPFHLAAKVASFLSLVSNVDLKIDSFFWVPDLESKYFETMKIKKSLIHFDNDLPDRHFHNFRASKSVQRSSRTT